MWFARFFGGRAKKPAIAPAPPPAAVAFPPSVTSKIKAPDLKLSMGVAPVAKSSKGFDPYNSGSFNRAKAWERSTLK
jgi:hypothetical protein